MWRNFHKAKGTEFLPFLWIIVSEIYTKSQLADWLSNCHFWFVTEFVTEFQKESAKIFKKIKNFCDPSCLYRQLNYLMWSDVPCMLTSKHLAPSGENVSVYLDPRTPECTSSQQAVTLKLLRWVGFEPTFMRLLVWSLSNWATELGWYLANFTYISISFDKWTTWGKFLKCRRSGLNPRPSDPKVQRWHDLRLRPLGHWSFVSLTLFYIQQNQNSKQVKWLLNFANLSEKIFQRKERKRRFFL